MPSVSPVTSILKSLETSSSLGMFARDTAGCLIARLSLARTPEEAREIAFAETTESAVFYFSAPALSKLASNIFQKKFNLTKEQFQTPYNNLKNLNPETAKNIKLAKFSQIAGVFGLILPFIYAIAPIRNLISKSGSGINKFTSLAGLEKNKTDIDKERKDAKEKAKTLIKKLSLISLLSLSGAFGAVGLSKNKNFYKYFEPLLNKVVKTLEFSKDNDLKLAHYGALIYPVSILGYFCASRDKYEVKENIRRFSVTVPLLFFGEKIIEKPIYGFFDKINKTNVLDNGIIKSYKDILSTKGDIQKNLLKTKNPAYALTFLTNTIFIAGAVALLNRIKTKENFKKDNKLKTTLKPMDIQEFIKLAQNKSSA